MGRYIVRRLAATLPLLLIISILTFAIIDGAPGDAAQMYADPDQSVDPKYIEQIRRSLGLDEPMYVRYVAWLGKTLRGDLGFSLRTRRPVILEIGERLPNTLLLSLSALLLTLVVGIPIGIISALKSYTILDNTLSILTLIGVSLPSFWVALLLIRFFSIHLNWFPASGMRSIRDQYEGWIAIADVTHHLALSKH